MRRTDEQFDELLRGMARREDTPLPSDLDERLEAVYARLDSRGQAVEKEEKPVKRKIFTLARVAAVAAVIALCLASMTVGALAFSTERVVEVPKEQETIEIEDGGFSLILPDEWKGKYVAEVRDGLCTVYVKSIYDWCMAREGFHDENGPILGQLFYVHRCYDEPMTKNEFYHRTPWPAFFLLSTEDGTYGLTEPSDVRTYLPAPIYYDSLDMDDPEVREQVAQTEEYEEMDGQIADILLEVDGKIVGALKQNGKDGPETIDLDDIGISLILPDEWKDKYTVVRDDERGVYNVFCKSVYDYCVSENLFIEDVPGKFPLMGLLFTVSWADDDDASWTTVPGYELAHTEGGSYVMTLTSDVEYPSQFVDPETLEPTEWQPDDPDLASIMREYPNASLDELVVMNRDYLTLYFSIKDIRLVLNGVMARALGGANG